MKILFVCLLVVSSVSLIIGSVDFIFFLINRYSRFHIGRWPDKKIWEQAIINKAITWSHKTPTVKITDNSRYMLFDMLQGKYRSNSIQSWQIGSIILGLAHIGSNKCQNAIEKTVDRLIDDDGMFRTLPTNVDCGLLAYSILKVSDHEKVKNAMDFAADLIREHLCDDGMICYTNDLKSDERYVDTIGLVCPFLACYASVYNKPEFAELAVEQIKIFTEFGLERETDLPNHAYSSSKKAPLGVYGWGRGTGWYVLGVLDTYKELADGASKEYLHSLLKRIADKYLLYQREDGGFGHILQMQNGYDSSITATFAYFYRSCSEILGDKRYSYISDRCLDKLISVTRVFGAIDWCQGDTKGIGVFSQTYDIMPFAQGMALRSINITELKND